MNEFIRSCVGCGNPLAPKHLRVQLAPPDEKWHEARVHDLTCLIDFLEKEEDAVMSGEDGHVFKAVRLPAGGPAAP